MVSEKARQLVDEYIREVQALQRLRTIGYVLSRDTQPTLARVLKTRLALLDYVAELEKRS